MKMMSCAFSSSRRSRIRFSRGVRPAFSGLGGGTAAGVDFLAEVLADAERGLRGGLLGERLRDSF
jgi:hypothetical protein